MVSQDTPAVSKGQIPKIYLSCMKRVEVILSLLTFICYKKKKKKKLVVVLCTWLIELKRALDGGEECDMEKKRR